MIKPSLSLRGPLRHAAGLLVGLAVVGPTLAGCDALPGLTSAGALARKGNAKACTHPDTVELVNKAIRGNGDHEISPAELEHFHVELSGTVMLEADKGVSVTCETQVAITGKRDSSFTYMVIPEAQGSGVQIRWSDQSDTLGLYNWAWYLWDRRQNSDAPDEGSSAPTELTQLATEPNYEEPATNSPHPEPAQPASSGLSASQPTNRSNFAPVVSENTRSQTPVVTNPVWLSHPRATMPQAALDADVNGRAEVQCDVTTEGALRSCQALSEWPVGYGFGRAAVEAAEASGRLRPRLVDGEPTPGKIAFATRFSAE